MEQWKKYPHIAGFMVSSYGKVKSFTGNLLSANPSKSGYCQVWLRLLTGYDRKSNKLLHRVVAETFILNPSNKPEVNHIDGNKANNHVYNLEWVTHQENCQKSYDTGQRKSKSGKDHHLYGKSPGKETKRLMRMAKLGKSHPKYKGYYLILGRRFYSLRVAGEVMNVSRVTIMRRTHNDKWKDYIFVLDPDKIG